ncbi:PRC-barrel domain-containing protein [Paraburkholderia sp.]|uniref:PRC-barrel domain-containing protein n=1 Tax=Paraburkholderia sp. TaxID=1926495 RepID=UPI00238FBB5A|nr:PRC-barrel domain-containing protein [Paraburkholderia sp.]MDE1181709.1 PRC-barrel domain-containing protein [Paraburkholderia sp.]
MKTITRLSSTALLAALVSTGWSASAVAQGTPQSITEKHTDVVQVASGFRASKLSGAPVYDRNKDKVGSVDDLIIAPNDQGSFAILSVGGFMGMGKHLVAVPMSHLQISKTQVVMPDVTSESLKAMPEFKYAPD